MVGLLYLLASDFLSGSVPEGRYPLYGLGIVVALLLILLSEFWKYNDYQRNRQYPQGGESHLPVVA